MDTSSSVRRIGDVYILDAAGLSGREPVAGGCRVSRIRTNDGIHAVYGTTASDKRGHGAGDRLVNDHGQGTASPKRIHGALPIRSDGPQVQPAGQVGGGHLEHRLQARGHPRAFHGRTARVVRSTAPGYGRPRHRLRLVAPSVVSSVPVGS